MKKLLIILPILLLIGCMENKYALRMQEIEISYQNKEITKSEYLHLKNEADQVEETRMLKAATISSKPQNKLTPF